METSKKKNTPIYKVGIFVLLGGGIFGLSLFIDNSPFQLKSEKDFVVVAEKTANNSVVATPLDVAPSESTSSQAPQSNPVASSNSIFPNKSGIVKPGIASRKNESSKNYGANAMLSVAKMEYNIQYQKSVNALQSPNRNQNLRITYHSDGFEAKPRIDSSENWNIAFKLKGIFKGEKASLQPTTNAIEKLEKNTLTYKHNGFDVEYINNEDGMRQNFIVYSKLNGDEPLKVEMSLTSEDLKLKCDGKAITSTFNGKQSYTYCDLRVWDANKNILPAHMELKNNVLALVVDDKNAEYPITIDPNSKQQNWKKNPAQNSASFGFKIALGDFNGDLYSDVLVGANGYDNGTTDEGMIFIFNGSSSGLSTSSSWSKDSDQGNWPCYGGGALTAGDLNGDGFDEVIVGAYQWDVDGGAGHDNEGMVWVFNGSASGPGSSANWSYSTASTGSFFGFCGATGDVNNDGYEDLIVGAEAQSNGESYEGRAYIFHGSSSGLSATPNWTTESNQTLALYGYSVACADVNGDTYDDVFIGAPDYDNGETDEGRVFLYYVVHQELVQQPAGHTNLIRQMQV